MRVTLRSSRGGSVRHNDRSFLEGKTAAEAAEIAPHIDADRTGQNKIFNALKNADEKTLRESELEIYKRLYSKSLEETNARYVAQRHPERCKKIEEVYTNKRTCPEEFILQIGDRTDKINPELFSQCCNEYLKSLQEWSREHGGAFVILNSSEHYDETSPHAHVRRVWQYRDENGTRHIGQNEALKRAGVPLPDPAKPEGRYNNRKMQFDMEMRARWQEICRSHGLDIETEPIRGRRHLGKLDYIAEQKLTEIAQLERQQEKIGVELNKKTANLDILRQQEEILQDDIKRLKRERHTLTDRDNELVDALKTDFRGRTYIDRETLDTFQKMAEIAKSDVKLRAKNKSLAATVEQQEAAIADLKRKNGTLELDATAGRAALAQLNELKRQQAPERAIKHHAHGR